MAAQTLWKGVIHFGDFRVPVGLFSAAVDRRIHFRLLCARDQTPLEQVMVDPRSGEVVPRASIRKGMELEDGLFVALTPEELAEVEPEPSRDIEITRFVSPERIEEPWYARPYLLGPRERPEAYFALAEALRRTGKVGVARWVMRKKAYAGVVRPFGDHLSLSTLRHAQQVVPAAELPRPAGGPPNPKEAQLAERLVSELEGHFDPEAFRDEHRDRVRELIEAKAEGEVIEMRPPEPRRRPAELAESLRASLEAAREGRLGA